MEGPVSMPGSFMPDFDHVVRPTLTTAYTRPSLYIPPQTPSASTSVSQSFHTAPRSISTAHYGGRKRARYGWSESSCTTPQYLPRDEPESCSASFESTQSPAPFVNTTYRIAGGLDTPTAAISSSYTETEKQLELDYRPSRFAPQSRTEPDGYFPCTPDALSRERNGRKRCLSSPQPQGWGKVVFGMVGDVAGKVFNFCLSGAFRGFHAGGGRGYNVDFATPVTVGKSTWTDLREKEDVFNENYQNQHYRGSTPVPGEFPDENFIEDYMSRPQYHQGPKGSTPDQHDYGAGGARSLRESWVVVGGPDTDSRENSPTRSARKVPKTSTFNQSRPFSKSSVPVRPRLAPSRPSRSSLAGSPGLASGQPASFASSRAPIDRDESLIRPQTSESRHRRSHSSITSPRRSLSVRDNPATSASPDVQKFERKLRKKERAHEDSIQRLNQQTKDLIREAREALGTRIDIDDEGQLEDEGYGEGTESMRESKW